MKKNICFIKLNPRVKELDLLQNVYIDFQGCDWWWEQKPEMVLKTGNVKLLNMKHKKYSSQKKRKSGKKRKNHTPEHDMS